MYVSLTHISHTLVPEIRVCPEMLHVLWYIVMLTRDLQLEQQGRPLLIVCHENYQQRQLGR